MIVSVQIIINTEILAFIAVLVLKLFSRAVLYINKKNNINCHKVGYLFKKIATFTGKLLQLKAGRMRNFRDTFRTLESVLLQST